MKLKITQKILSQNAFSNRRGYAAQFGYARYRNEWFSAVMAALPPGSHDSHESKKKRVIITSFRNRLLDKGNLYGGAKPILDALVHYGILRDDSPKWCDEHICQETVPQKEECTTISIQNA